MRDNYDGHVGIERRAPRITQRDYLTLRRLSKLLRHSVERYVKEESEVLDLGCKEKPYQPFFLGKAATYLGADIKRAKAADILCNGEKLPFKDCVFSACLCLQVLEHTDEPRTMVGEIFRVLKPNGVLFLSTHGNWPIHDSHDYWRWTRGGLVKILASFHIVEIHRCGNTAASFVQLLELNIQRSSLGIIIIVLLNKLADLLDRMTWLDEKLPQLAANYFLVARKM